MKTEIRIIILSIIFFMFVCVGDAVWEHIWLPDMSLWDALIFKVTIHELYHRLAVTVAFLVFGLITARVVGRYKLAKEDATNARNEWERTFNSIQDLVAIIDKEHKIVRINKAMADRLGLSPGEVVGRQCYELVHESKGPHSFCPHDQMLIDGKHHEVEIFEPHIGGTFLISVSPIYDENGRLTGSVHISRDIAERKLAEAALKASEERTRQLIEVAPIGITVVRQGVYIYSNPAFVRMFGYDDVNEIIGLPLESLCVPEQREFIKKMAMDRAAGLHIPHYEITGLSKTGKRLNLLVWGTLIDFDGVPATLAFVIDVTKEKSLRSQLIQAQKMESLGALAGGVAHDFNNLLQVVLGYSELMISSRKLDERTVADLSKISHAAKDGAELAKRLLAFSRKEEINRIPVNLNDQVEKLKGMLERTIPKMIEIRLDLNADPAMITADPTQIDQVLLNLAVNARDAMPNGGKLNIETTNVTLDEEICSVHVGTKPGNCLLLTVSDTGKGMDSQTLEKIFEPFFTTKAAGKGTGLGLSIVYGVVKRHGGFITCSSESGRGTTFKIYLPALSENSVKNVDHTPDITHKGGNETILLVDDEEFVRDLAVRFLTSVGYNVITASNGREAIEIFERDKGKISLVILDLIMPEIGGLQCMAELTRIDPKARIIIASGFAVDEDERKIIEATARGFVSKPYQVQHALDAVRKAIDEG